MTAKEHMQSSSEAGYASGWVTFFLFLNRAENRICNPAEVLRSALLESASVTSWLTTATLTATEIPEEEKDPGVEGGRQPGGGRF